MTNKFKIVLTDTRGCTINAAYYPTLELAQKRIDSVANDQYWSNNGMVIATAEIKPLEDF